MESRKRHGGKKMKNRKNIKADAVKGNAVLVRMNRHSFPENGILSTEEFNRIAGYKEEGKRLFSTRTEASKK